MTNEEKADQCLLRLALCDRGIKKLSAMNINKISDLSQLSENVFIKTIHPGKWQLQFINICLSRMGLKFKAESQ